MRPRALPHKQRRTASVRRSLRSLWLSLLCVTHCQRPRRDYVRRSEIVACRPHTDPHTLASNENQSVRTLSENIRYSACLQRSRAGNGICIPRPDGGKPRASGRRCWLAGRGRHPERHRHANQVRCQAHLQSAPALIAARLGSSFRDPCGFLFSRNGTLYRQVQPECAADYDKLIASGLYDTLAGKSLLVSHEEVSREEALTPGAYRVLRPDPVSVVSLPYEWCFSQLRAAALLTLEVQKIAIEHDMILKDASAFNVLFRGASPLFIDTLSFTRLETGKPWVGYRQFCQHFLAPLALQAFVDVRLRELQRSYLDGVPLDLASRLLPVRSWAHPWAAMHLHLHARAISRFSSTAHPQSSARKVSRAGLSGILRHLTAAIESLTWPPRASQWSDYEESHGYAPAAHGSKRSIVERLLKEAGPARVLDLGANTGHYSRLARDLGAEVVAVDQDPVAVERMFLRCVADKEQRITPMCIDLANPAPSQGWAHDERRSFADRASADVVLVLALLHHLAIGNNVPLAHVAAYLRLLGRELVIEWIPKDDPQTQRLLQNREDVFSDYTEENFLAAMQQRFIMRRREPVDGSRRVVYWFVASG